MINHGIMWRSVLQRIYFVFKIEKKKLFSLILFVGTPSSQLLKNNANTTHNTSGIFNTIWAINYYTDYYLKIIFRIRSSIAFKLVVFRTGHEVWKHWKLVTSYIRFTIQIDQFNQNTIARIHKLLPVKLKISL